MGLFISDDGVRELAERLAEVRQAPARALADDRAERDRSISREFGAARCDAAIRF